MTNPYHCTVLKRGPSGLSTSGSLWSVAGVSNLTPLWSCLSRNPLIWAENVLDTASAWWNRFGHSSSQPAKTVPPLSQTHNPAQTLICFLKYTYLFCICLLSASCSFSLKSFLICTPFMHIYSYVHHHIICPSHPSVYIMGYCLLTLSPTHKTFTLSINHSELERWRLVNLSLQESSRLLFGTERWMMGQVQRFGSYQLVTSHWQ